MRENYLRDRRLDTTSREARTLAWLTEIWFWQTLGHGSKFTIRVACVLKKFSTRLQLYSWLSLAVDTTTGGNTMKWLRHTLSVSRFACRCKLDNFNGWNCELTQNVCFCPVSGHTATSLFEAKLWHVSNHVSCVCCTCHFLKSRIYYWNCPNHPDTTRYEIN